MLIGIAAGHSKKTTGERRAEYDICRRTANYLRFLLGSAGYGVVEPTANIYALENDPALNAKIDLFNSAGVDLAVELHLNAGGGKYSTALYWNDKQANKISYRGQCLAADIAKYLSTLLPWPGQGVQPQSVYGRSLAFLNNTNAPAVIVEGGFKDNKKHRKYLEAEKGVLQYAIAVYLGIDRFIREGGI